MPATSDAIELAVSAARAADDRQAFELVMLDVADLLTLVDVFLVATGRTDRQLKAIADAIERGLREEHDRRPARREGTFESGWYLLDYGEVVVHLFDEEHRDMYALERLWADVPHLEPLTGEAVEATPVGGSQAR